MLKNEILLREIKGSCTLFYQYDKAPCLMQLSMESRKRNSYHKIHIRTIFLTEKARLFLAESNLAGWLV